jgi:hypothetical protein
MVVQAKMEKWSGKEVSEWLKTECSISEQQAQIFTSEKVNGPILQSLTIHELRGDPFNLTFGEAKTIILEIQKLQKSSG